MNTLIQKAYGLIRKSNIKTLKIVIDIFNCCQKNHLEIIQIKDEMIQIKDKLDNLIELLKEKE